jgi:hypothetical protein
VAAQLSILFLLNVTDYFLSQASAMFITGYLWQHRELVKTSAPYHKAVLN